jgi:uncharacterized protein with von Willebrand factor type A (vWA) domain
MLIKFFFALKKAKIPVTIRELLDLLQALDKRLVYSNMEEFYMLSRTILVKDEKHFDKFDQAFAAYFDGLPMIDALLEKDIPEEWLREQLKNSFSAEELARIEELGGVDKLMEAMQERLRNQEERHEGGEKNIGTDGKSALGKKGNNPSGFNVKGERDKNNAAKMWHKREFKDLDDSVELGTRNIKVALRRLRRLARTGAEEELNLDDTITSTARKGGYLDIKMQPERKNRVKVLLFFDVGGSMDPYIRVCEELFSAARSEFKNMEMFYFHNFIYDAVWKSNQRRWAERTATWDLLNTYSPDYRIIFVGDAMMSPYEIHSEGGCIEYYNEESGATWMQRITNYFDKVVWLNPEPERAWKHSNTVQVTQALVKHQMYPLTMKGIEESMKYLSR